MTIDIKVKVTRIFRSQQVIGAVPVRPACGVSGTQSSKRGEDAVKLYKVIHNLSLTGQATTDKNKPCSH